MAVDDPSPKPSRMRTPDLTGATGGFGWRQPGLPRVCVEEWYWVQVGWLVHRDAVDDALVFPMVQL